MYTILVVEDEKKVNRFISQGLSESGYNVIPTFSAEEAHDLFSENVSLSIIDVGLPGSSGYELCRKLKARNPKIPALILTALSGIDDKLIGFESGADDYLVKPFEFLELLARINVLIKRSNVQKNFDNVLRFADLILDLDRRTARRGTSDIDLTAKEFALLELFMRNTEKVLSRVHIAEKIWDINFDTGTNVIDVYVNFLRKKIDKGHEPKLIHTKIGLGYIMTDKL